MILVLAQTVVVDTIDRFLYMRGSRQYMKLVYRLKTIVYTVVVVS